MVLEKLLSQLAVHVNPFALCQLSVGWRLRLPGPRDVMLHFVLRGQAIVRGTRGASQMIGPHWLAIVPEGCAHTLEWDGQVTQELHVEAPPPGSPVCRIVAGPEDKPDLLVACGAVSVRYGQSLGLFDRLSDVLAVNLSGIPRVPGLFDGIMAEQAQLGPGSGVMTAALMTECLVHVFRRLAEQGDGSLPWLPALGDDRLSRAVDAILEKPGDPHTVESLAARAGMSRSSFSDRFHSAFRRTPMSLVHHVRMQHAAGLLARNGNLSIDEVATRVGYSSRSHFSQAFKRHCGVSPGAFRTSQPPGPPPGGAP